VNEAVTIYSNCNDPDGLKSVCDDELSFSTDLRHDLPFQPAKPTGILSVHLTAQANSAVVI